LLVSLRNAKQRLGGVTMVFKVRLHDADHFERLFDMPLADVLLRFILDLAQKLFQGFQCSLGLALDEREAGAKLDVPLGMSHLHKSTLV
jgi:hypothetical protein